MKLKCYLFTVVLFMQALLYAQTWTLESSGTTINLLGLGFDSGTNGCFAGGSINNPVAKRTNNAGISWNTTSTLATSIIRGVHFNSASEGWIVGDNNIISKFDGVAWATQTSNFPTNFGINSIHYFGNTWGCIVGAQGSISTTTNGGSNWTLQTSGTTNELRSVHISSATDAYAVGAAGTIRKTTNGGTTWTTSTSGTTQTLTDVFFISNTTGWTVGANGTILKTIDGGSTWVPKTSGVTVVIRSVSFATANLGWVVGDGGLILRTVDGGENWTTVASGTSQQLNAIYMTSPTNGWIVGNGGVLLNYCSSPAQPSTISGSTTVCSGSSQTYSVTAVSGVGYQWTLPVGWTGSSTSNSITVVPGTSGGTISVVAKNGSCSSSPRTLAVNVSLTPAQPGTITGNATPCEGITNTYSISPVAGATSYTWSFPSDWTHSTTTTSASGTIGINSGTISVTANNGVCISTPRNLSVSTLGSVDTIFGPSTVCANTNNVFSTQSISGATQYMWTKPAGWVGVSLTSSITVTSDANNGFITVRASNGSCMSLPFTLNVNVLNIPSQPTAILGSTSVCEGINEAYSTTSDINATSYTWNLPIGWSGASTTNSITASTSSSGNITVTADNSCGSSTPTSLFVNVNSAPSEPNLVTGTTTLCENSSETYNLNTDTNANSYTWIVPNNWSGSSTSNSINLQVDNTSGQIAVFAINACGNSDTLTIPIMVNSNPIANSSLSLDTYTASPTGLNYQWIDCSSNTSLSGETNQTFIPISNGSYAVIVSENGCSDTSNCIAINNVGLQQLDQQDNNIEFYPNPSSSFVYFDHMITSPIEIYSVEGSLIKVTNLPESKSLDINMLSNGVYYIHFQFNGNLYSKILVKN